MSSWPGSRDSGEGVAPWHSALGMTRKKGDKEGKAGDARYQVRATAGSVSAHRRAAGARRAAARERLRSDARPAPGVRSPRLSRSAGPHRCRR